MFKALSTTLLGLVTVVAVAVGLSPALRTAATQQWSNHFGWTDAARQADPVGFAQYAERQLSRDLEELQRTRRELAAEVGQLVRRTRQQQALRDQGMALAEEFRTQYQLASANGGFPLVVRNAAYTREQAEAQVSHLLAEMEGYEQSLALLTQVRQEAEVRLEALVVKVNQTETQLATLGTKRGLLRAERLSADGELLLAQLDELLTGNAQVIAENPVRTVEELLAAAPQPAATAVGRQAVEAFLSARSAVAEPGVMRQEARSESTEHGSEQAGEVMPTSFHVSVGDETASASVTVGGERKRRPAASADAADPRPVFQQW